MKTLQLRVRIFCGLLMLPAVTALAADTKPEWTVDDLAPGESARQFSISPDCASVVWVKSKPEKDHSDPVGNLFLSSLASGEEIQLTRGTDDCDNPKWSPDGKLVAFLSSRPNPKAKAADKNRRQIWLLNPSGGEPWPCTSGDRAISIFNWAGTNEIIYLSQEEPSAYESTNKARGDETIVVGDDVNEPPVRLFRVDVTSSAVNRITDNSDRIRSFWISPDGTQAVTVHETSLRTTYDQSLRRPVFLVDLKNGNRKEIFNDPKCHLLSPVTWERDGRGFYAAFTQTSDNHYDYPAIVELCHYAVVTGQIEKVDLDWERGLCTAELRVIDPGGENKDGGFITLLANGVHPGFARYLREGNTWQREWITGLHSTNVFAFELGRDNRTLVCDYSSSTLPEQWEKAVLNGARLESPVPLTHLNPGLEKKRKARCETLHWTGALGETVEGMLCYPLDYTVGQRYPLIVEIHGGPASLFGDQWGNNNIFNARGAFVFRPNYHGSACYGLKWVESNLGRLNELEVEDINKGVDHLVAQGLADPEKLAVMGWSNGGTLTAAVTVATNRYKAAIAGDGPIDWIDYWAKSDVGGWFCRAYFGTNPLDDPARLMRFSSFYQMSKVTTPTLIMFGEEDKRVSVDQGWMYYRALQQSSKTDVRLVIFPGERHGPAKTVYVRRALEEEMNWLDKYLFAAH